MYTHTYTHTHTVKQNGWWVHAISQVSPWRACTQPSTVGDEGENAHAGPPGQWCWPLCSLPARNSLARVFSTLFFYHLFRGEGWCYQISKTKFWLEKLSCSSFHANMWVRKSSFVFRGTKFCQSVWLTILLHFFAHDWNVVGRISVSESWNCMHFLYIREIIKASWLEWDSDLPTHGPRMFLVWFPHLCICL